MAARGDDSLRDWGAQAPHGPNVTGHHVATADVGDMRMNLNEAEVFQTILKPDDMYDADGTYWADLPVGKKIKFVSKNELKESNREFWHVMGMFKKDPLSPVGAYFRNMVIPGMGLLLEG